MGDRSTSDNRARRPAPRRPLRGMACLLALVAGAAVAAATTSAQASPSCGPATTTVPDAGCTTTTTPELPPPPPEEPPPAGTPPQSSAPSAPVTPKPPAEPAICPDGTFAPCPPPEALGSPEPEPESRPGRRAACRRPVRRRAGTHRRGRCPRAHGPGESRGHKKRHAPGAKARKQCERLVFQGLLPASAATCRRAESLYVVGRVASRPLADPLAPGSRLDARFARLLKRVAGGDWPLVLATLRAHGRTGSAPARAAALRRLTRRVHGHQATEPVDALADYHRAVGLEGLTRGLHAVKGALQGRVLGSERVNLYPGGRFDVGAGRIDVRVLVTILYLAQRQGSVTVTSLISGHGIFTKAGHLSLHPLGRAVDIAAVGGVPVIGNQQPGGAMENALRSIMLLPAELRPSELISLFDLGGPSFAMADHADHIHVGF